MRVAAVITPVERALNAFLSGVFFLFGFAQSMETIGVMDEMTEDRDR